MGVGTDPLVCYEGETPEWVFTVTDLTGNLTSLSGHTIPAVIKATAASPDPPLISISCTVISASNPMQFKASGFEVDIDPGTYVFSARRENTGPTKKFQYVHCPLTVLNSASQD